MRVQGPIITPSGQLITGVRATDGTHNFPTATSLTFNPQFFYLSNDSQGKPMVNFVGSKRVLVRLNADLALVSGNPVATAAFTMNNAGLYDAGGWFSAGNAYVTVPAGVTLVTMSIRTVFTPTGTTGASSHVSTAFLNNGVAITPTGYTSRTQCITASGIAPAPCITGGPFRVKPGDQLSVGFRSTWSSASAMNVTAANTYFGVEALNV